MTRKRTITMKVILILISLLGLLLMWKSFNLCVEISKDGGADDYKMVFIADPFFFFLIGSIRLLSTRKLGLNLIYRFQDFVCGVIILIPLFVDLIQNSANLGIVLSLLIILFNVVETTYMLFKKFDSQTT